MAHTRRSAALVALSCLASAVAASTAHAQSAVPLVVHNPYFSAWSTKDSLAEDWPRHWSGAILGMSGMMRVDGQPYRWCGPLPQDVPPVRQVSCRVLPTSTIFTFEAGPAQLVVEFAAPVGPGLDASSLSQTVTAVRFAARSLDQASHVVDVYLDVTGEWCSDSPSDQLTWTRLRSGRLDTISMGTVDQPVLDKACDRCVIDWGRILLSAPHGTAEVAIAAHAESRREFALTGSVTSKDDARQPRAVSDNWPVLAASATFMAVPGGSPASAPPVFFVSFDEGRAIELFERPLRPLWRLTQFDITSCADQLLDALEKAPPPGHGDGFDRGAAAFMADATEVGGPEYAALLALAYRQVLGGHAIVADWDRTPLMFSKENTSNGCIATVDVIYPACPFFLYHDPELLKAQLRPVLMYAQSPRWQFPFAPHDLGTYPKANGQVYGGGEYREENQMPVEESGNMLIMLAALAKVEGNAEFSRPYLPLLAKWAAYLRDHGVDPVHQLCTDDFAGHMARNANLSAKTCVALGAYAQLLGALGDAKGSSEWRTVAEQGAATWQKLAAGREVSVLAFGAPEHSQGWSQKYNLVWDRVLGLELFPSALLEREMAWYLKQLKPFGLPLDSRAAYTKLDWSVWSACLTGRRADFDAVMAPVYRWVNASPPPSRVPLSDWYETGDGVTRGMYARTVVGGVWMPMLMHRLGCGLR